MLWSNEAFVPQHWACALEPGNHNYWASMPQLLKPACPKASTPLWEATAMRSLRTTTREYPLLSATREKRVRTAFLWLSSRPTWVFNPSSSTYPAVWPWAYCLTSLGLGCPSLKWGWFCSLLTGLLGEWNDSEQEQPSLSTLVDTEGALPGCSWFLWVLRSIRNSRWLLCPNLFPSIIIFPYHYHYYPHTAIPSAISTTLLL